MSNDSTTDAKPIQDTKTGKAAAGPVKWLDERVGLATLVKTFGRKVFPDHWSFLLGEIALFSFIVLLLSGTFLTFWFIPSQGEVVYDGSYAPLRGLEMSEAFASTMDLSFEVRGGLLMRQMHHWSAMLFIAAITIHMLRMFFTGAYRKPREINWLIGLGIFMLAIVEGFAGYSLPDDLLSGTGLRIAEGLMRSIPIVGTYVSYFVFGGEFPGDALIARLFIVHVLLIPGILLGLITVHLILVVYHKHTQFPGPGKTEKNVIGPPALPIYAAKAGGFFFIVFGVSTLMSAIFQINAIWNYGPYNPSEVTAGSQPDWYMGWLEGGLRIMPNWESTIFGWTFSWNVFVPGVLLLGILFTLLGLYPFVERWVNGDDREHHLLDRPRNAPIRTAFGVAGIAFYGLLWAAGGNDILAVWFHTSIYHITWFMRFAVFIGPVIAFIVTKRICLALQRKDRELVLHGYETGIIVRSPDGQYTERHTPIGQAEAYRLTEHSRVAPAELPPETDDNGVRAPTRIPAKLRAKASAFYFGDAVNKPTSEELAEARHHGDGEHAELEAAEEDGFLGATETGVPKRHD
ncbi:MAG TPA: cytochrome bc complex cytochrome b subunit [Nocardioidaceae bacterium]|nr:cytochrome bc complex cytochrome b subunit [Nocardioidaceae bacterium]